MALRLRAARREGDTELLFAGVVDPLVPLPAQLHDVRVRQIAPSPAPMTGRSAATTAAATAGTAATAATAATAGTAATAAAATTYRIEAREGSFELRARSVQWHRDAGAAFFGAVPTPPVPRAARLGWSLLLGVLRLPGAARLLRRTQR